MNSGRVPAPTLESFQRDLGLTPLADQQTGGAILWGAGDLITILAVLGILISWANYEEKVVAVREDRRLAREREAGRPALTRHPPSDPVTGLSDLTGKVRAYWDADAATYDHSADHGARVAGPAGGLERRPAPAAAGRAVPGAGRRRRHRVPVLAAARLGHRVTALDLSGGMLERLRAAADREGLEVEAVQGGAEEPPLARSTPWSSGTCCGRCPDRAALAAWRAVAPEGRLVLFEGLGAGPTSSRPCGQAREGLRKLRGEPDHHHDHYDPSMPRSCRWPPGLHLDQLVELVEEAGWGPVRLERLGDIEWVHLLELPVGAPARGHPAVRGGRGRP